MHGAILGDIWGSIFETIPKHPRRLSMSPTDDTFLTCACFEFLQQLTAQELASPKDNFDSIYLKAVHSLKEWGRLFPEPGAYSPGFMHWANEAGTDYKVAKTNGSLMRQSPIALYCFSKNIPLEKCVELAKIFCHTTHKSDESFISVEHHISVIYLSLTKELNKEKLSLFYPQYIKPLNEWKILSSTVKNNFIWTAQDSLGIALSAIEYSQNWHDLMRFFISISGDVDTYAAIAGPIAQIYFGLPVESKILKNTILIENSPRTQRIYQCYNQLESLYVQSFK